MAEGGTVIAAEGGSVIVAEGTTTNAVETA